jgi:hypothetical protein
LNSIPLQTEEGLISGGDFAKFVD